MKKTVETRTFVPAPREIVYESFTSHESYKKLPGVLSSKLLTEGEGKPSSGVGAIRQIRTLAFTLIEEVVATDVPFRWDYQFHKWPVPVPHAGGRMQFEEVEGGTLMTWQTSFSTDVALPLKLGTPGYTVFSKVVIQSLPLLLRRVAVQNYQRAAQIS